MTTNSHGVADRAAAIRSRDALAAMLVARTVYVEEVGKSFDRVVARLYVAGPDGKLVSVGRGMIEAGMAKPYP